MALGWFWSLALVAAVVFLVVEVLRRVWLNSGDGRAVLITGCDTGFGNALAKQLDAKGFSVIAGCLTPGAAQALGEGLSSRSRTVVMDVTSQESVDAAVEVTRRALDSAGLKGLYAVVNNAGVLDGSAVELTPLRVYEKVMSVNLYGVIRVTKAVLPLVQRVRGRVVNITSIAGTITAPGFSVYSCAKYAAEAFSDGLRREMRAFGVPVILIEPGFMKTPIVMNAGANLTALFDAAPQAVKDVYGADWNDKLLAILRGIQSNAAEDPQIVVDALLNAVASRLPRDRYVLGTSGRTLRALSMLPTWLSDPLLLTSWVNPANPPKP